VGAKERRIEEILQPCSQEVKVQKQQGGSCGFGVVDTGVYLFDLNWGLLSFLI